MIFLQTILSSIGASAFFSLAAVWLLKKWISARLIKSIQHEYDIKLGEFKAEWQKIIDENRITFNWWHVEQAKAIKETYVALAELLTLQQQSNELMEKISANFKELGI